jgi:hypothetical protein
MIVQINLIVSDKDNPVKMKKTLADLAKSLGYRASENMNASAMPTHLIAQMMTDVARGKLTIVKKGQKDEG